jgi:hypothetical protein
MQAPHKRKNFVFLSADNGGERAALYSLIVSARPLKYFAK